MSATTLDRAPRAAARAERRLLLLAALVVGLAALLLTLSRTEAPTPGTFLPLGGLGLLVIAAHVAVRRLAPAADPTLLPLATLLNGLGLVLIRRVDLAVSGSALASTQLTWTVLGLVLMVLTLVVVRDPRSLTRLAYSFGLLTILLLLLPLVPGLGQRVYGAQLWIRVGPFSFQPGEAAKITAVVFLAGYLERTRVLLAVPSQRLGPVALPALRHLAPILSIVAVALGIMILQRDLGASLLFFGVATTMLYVATGRAAYPVIGGLAFAGGATLAYQLFSHIRLRVAVWLDPWADVTGDGYQIAQVLFALGTGGLTGTGLGGGRPADIPFAATDAIFAVAGEELGLLGATAILVAFGVLVARGYRIALQSSDEVTTLLAAGLTTIVALQVFVIVGGLTRVVPLTGITLPFVSYGGSSLVANYVLLGLLLRTDDRVHAREAA